MEVEAERITKFNVLETADGSLRCYAGDWLVRDPFGCIYTITDRVFRAQFDPMTEAADAALVEPIRE